MKIENEVKKTVINRKVKVVWIGLGIFTLLLRFLFELMPNVAELVYSRGIFPAIRFCLDYTLGLLPIPLFYLVVTALIFLLVFKIVRRVKNGKKIKEKISWQARMLKGVLSLLAFLGALVFFFYFLWGFNYQRLPIEAQLKIEPVPLDAARIEEEANIAFQMVVAARKDIPGVSEAPLDSRFLPEALEKKTRENLKQVLKSMGYPVPGRVRARQLNPAGLLMGFGIGGIYLPFTGEAYIPAKLTAMELPFTMAHEMAHGLGFTDEGTANFLAYLACISAKDPLIKYSGCLRYFSHITSDLFSASREEYRDIMKRLPRCIMADRKAIFHNWKHYLSWLADLGRRVNDIYLKSQGIKEGVKSYNRLVILAAAWRAKMGNSEKPGGPNILKSISKPLEERIIKGK